MKDALNLLILCFLKAEVKYMKGVKSTEQYFIVLYSTVLYCNPMLNV